MIRLRNRFSRWVAVGLAMVLVSACTELSAERSASTTSLVESTTTSSLAQPGSSSTVPASETPSWATSTIVQMDPVTLARVGPAIPSGFWAEGSAVTDELVAVATWPMEESGRANARWRLVVAARDTGDLLFSERVGDMNVIGMFAAPSGEVMIVEPIRSADWNFADGFVIHAYDPSSNELREAARFEDGDFQPYSMRQLSDGQLGFMGTERNGDLFDRQRIVVFDWQTNETVMDVTLDDLPLEANAPDGIFVNPMYHPVVWDETRNRALVVHAHEEAVTAISVPDGAIEKVPLTEAQSIFESLLAWLIPSTHAKGLPSSQRSAVISGDYLYVAGATVAFEPDGESTYRYTQSATDFLKVRLDTLEVVDRAQLGITVVAGGPNGGYLVGGGLTSSGQEGPEVSTVESEEYSDVLVIDPETMDITARNDDFTFTSEWQAQNARAANHLYLEGPAGTIVVFDPATGDLNTTEVRGFDLALLQNAIRYESQTN